MTFLPVAESYQAIPLSRAPQHLGSNGGGGGGATGHTRMEGACLCWGVREECRLYQLRLKVD